MPLLPNHHLLLTQAELILLARYSVFKVKAVRHSGVLIAAGSLLFFLKRRETRAQVGDTLILDQNMLVGKHQPLFI